ncbi:MAG: hypothetical protein E7114_07390 [Bacteroidales bacterium]|nr:hypothetical protein [Bacteroidales bacterium]
MEEAIAIIIVTITILISNWRIRKWKKEAATAYFIIGQKATTSDESEWAYRKAFKYGHTNAKLFYIYAAANTFSGRKPLTPFTITSDKGESPIVAIFYDYYIRTKHLPYASDIQQEITQRVLELKDGLNPSSDLYSEALRTLEAYFNENWKTPQGPTIIFMPCSSEQAYFNRFATLARSLSQRYHYNTAIDAIQYTNSRSSKHRSQNRNAIESNSNIVISPKIIGKQVIIIDDVITTGNSLHQFAKELRTYGVTIKAAVFLAQTAKYPTDKELFREIRKIT